MVMASFSITETRSAVIDYSAPYYHSGFSILSITRPSTETNWLLFLEPFTYTMWLMILLICVIVFCALVSLDLKNNRCLLIEFNWEFLTAAVPLVGRFISLFLLLLQGSFGMV